MPSAIAASRARRRSVISSIDAAPLDRVRLELVERLGHRRGRGALELLAEPDHGLPLLVARRSELGRLALDPRLDVGDRLLLALGQPGELRLEVALGALEVVGDPLQPLVEPPLDVGERVRERLARAPLALGERRAPLLAEPPLLRRELRDRVGALAGERAPDLLGVRGRLLGDGRVDLGPGVGDERVGRGRRSRARRRASQRTTAATTAAARQAARIQTITPETL